MAVTHNTLERRSGINQYFSKPSTVDPDAALRSHAHFLSHFTFKTRLLVIAPLFPGFFCGSISRRRSKAWPGDRGDRIRRVTSVAWQFPRRGVACSRTCRVVSSKNVILNGEHDRSRKRALIRKHDLWWTCEFHEMHNEISFSQFWLDQRYVWII